MYFRSDDEQTRTVLKLSLFALNMLVVFNLAMIALGYYLGVANPKLEPTDKLLRNIIFFVAVADLAAIYIVKKKMLTRLFDAKKSGHSPQPGSPYKELLSITIIITAMCAAPSVYGLVLTILGEKIEVLLFFVAMSLIGYQFFRLRPKDFETSDE